MDIYETGIDEPVKGVPRIRKILGGTAAVGLALLGQQRLSQHSVVDAVILYFIATVLFVAMFGNGAGDRLERHRVAAIKWRGRWTWGWAIVSLAAIALAVIAWRRFHFAQPSVDAWQLYAASIVVFVVAALICDGRSALFDKGAKWNWTLAVCLLAVVTLATVLRVYRLGQLPFGTWYDEAANGLEALRIINEPQYRPVYTDGVNSAGHYLFLIVAAFKLFGINIESIRLVSAVMGVGVVLAAYLAGREIFGNTIGLVFAVCLGVSRWAIDFSRLGMYNISTPLFELLTIAFLWRALRRGRITDYTLAGLSLGLGLCFYAAFQLFIVVIVFYVIYLALVDRAFVRKAGTGLLITAACTLLVMAPLVKFAYEKPDVYFSRVRNTSLFSDTAPDQRVQALLGNLRKHLLMFNYHGDPNGRHNLPGEPMLDPMTAALFVLGAGLSLWRVRRPRYLLMPVWLVVMLMGGVFSLDFEAPQSLRSIGAMPVAYMLAVVPLYELWKEWRESGGRYFPQVITLAVALLLLPIGYYNIDAYFNRQANDFASWNAFSTPETIAASILNSLDDQTEAYVISLFDGHPTIRFLTQNKVHYHRLDTTGHLPINQPADKNMVLILDGERQLLFDEARKIYPGATFQEIRPPFGGPVVLYTVRVSRTELAQLQGLTGTYYRGDTWAGPPVAVRRDATIDFTWPNAAPVALPFSVEWEGVLDVSTYGPHQFFLKAPGYAELYIGEERILQGNARGDQPLTAAVILARGNHTIRLRLVGAPGPVSLGWRPPDRAAEVIPARFLYVPPVASHGLLGRYFPNGDWQAPEAFAQIDPTFSLYFHITPLPRPYTVEWTGKIAIPQAGSYGFGLQSVDDSTLWIDGREITASRNHGQYHEGSVQLATGLHDIRIRYADHTDHTYIELYWIPPAANGAGRRQIIPPEVLFPPQKNYERIKMSSLAEVTFAPPADAAVTPPAAMLPGNVEIFASGLVAPKGIAVSTNGRVYVAEPDAKQVTIFSGDGALLKRISGGAEPFRAPFDLSVTKDGHLFVLDAGAGEIDVFDQDGGFIQSVPADPEALHRARGLNVDADGNIWVASTPQGDVVRLASGGEIAQRLGHPSGSEEWKDMQPIDVVSGGNGRVFVTDSGTHKLLTYDSDGRFLLAWDIPVANSMDGSHLAINDAGNVFMTEPESGRVVKLSPEGEKLGTWSVRTPQAPNVKPVGIAVDKEGAIWVADTDGGRIVRLAPGDRQN